MMLTIKFDYYEDLKVVLEEIGIEADGGSLSGWEATVSSIDTTMQIDCDNEWDLSFVRDMLKGLKKTEPFAGGYEYVL